MFYDGSGSVDGYVCHILEDELGRIGGCEFSVGCVIFVCSSRDWSMTPVSTLVWCLSRVRTD